MGMLCELHQKISYRSFMEKADQLRNRAQTLSGLDKFSTSISASMRTGAAYGSAAAFIPSLILGNGENLYSYELTFDDRLMQMALNRDAKCSLLGFLSAWIKQILTGTSASFAGIVIGLINVPIGTLIFSITGNNSHLQISGIVLGMLIVGLGSLLGDVIEVLLAGIGGFGNFLINGILCVVGAVIGVGFGLLRASGEALISMGANPNTCGT